MKFMRHHAGEEEALRRGVMGLEMWACVYSWVHYVVGYDRPNNLWTASYQLHPNLTGGGKTIHITDGGEPIISRHGTIYRYAGQVEAERACERTHQMLKRTRTQ